MAEMRMFALLAVLCFVGGFVAFIVATEPRPSRLDRLQMMHPPQARPPADDASTASTGQRHRSKRVGATGFVPGWSVACPNLDPE